MISCSEKVTIGPDEVVTLPIIFHVVHKGDGIGYGVNFAAEKIYRQIDMLNANFGNTNPNYSSEEINIQFRTSKISPSGTQLPEEGIHRMIREENAFDGKTFFELKWVKESMWNPDEYINIWVAPFESDDYDAWATSPLTAKASGKNHVKGLTVWAGEKFTQGIVINSNDGNMDGNGDLITHEMGHYFGLFHVFNEADCEDDDYCDDTYHYDRSEYSPLANSDSIHRKTCIGDYTAADNFMDYYYYSTQRFTADQKDRMRKVLMTCPFRTKLKVSDQRTSSDKSSILNPEVIY